MSQDNFFWNMGLSRRTSCDNPNPVFSLKNFLSISPAFPRRICIIYPEPGVRQSMFGLSGARSHLICMPLPKQLT